MGKSEENLIFSDEEDCPDCPLCMEALEIDDQSFYPCGCGYQICRFCWHRLRTNENGLCPACRKEYKEDPANFKPLTCEDIVRIKNEKKQRSLEKKQKMAESRKHLSDIRVLQRNLVFVTGIPPKLADVEVLKKPEYFGRYGKIHKCVLNQQGPVATAYATYVRDEDAFKAVLGINGTYLQNNILRASLGTTKYCSYFLRHLPCPKQVADCMYLHGLGDGAASFTKADMQAGKHQQYENIIFREYFSKKAETMKQNMARQKVSSKDDLCQNSTREAWCSNQSDMLDTRSIRSISESEHFFNKSSHSDPELNTSGQSGTFEGTGFEGCLDSLGSIDDPTFVTGCLDTLGSIDTAPVLDWKEINSQRRGSLSSPSEDELDFDPWEISKDGLEELMQKQKDDPIPAPQPIPVSYPEQQLPAPTQQPPPQQFHLPQNYQVNTFLPHPQQHKSDYLLPFQDFTSQQQQQQQPSQPFNPFNFGGLQQQQPLNPVDQLFAMHNQHKPGQLKPAQQHKQFHDHYYQNNQGLPGLPHMRNDLYDMNQNMQGDNFNDIRLHDPSIISTSTHSPQDMQQQQRPNIDMSSLQKGLQELFPHANISFSDPFPMQSNERLFCNHRENDLCKTAV